MRKPLFIYGAGGLGREVLSMVAAMEEWEVKGFLDDDIKIGTKVRGIDVIGGRDAVANLVNPNIIFAIGNPWVKQKLVEELTIPMTSPVLIHPSAILQNVSSISLGPGTIITAGAILTTDINIGSHVLINLNTTIGHDSAIGNYSSIMPGVNIAGSVVIGQSVLLGAGCNIMNRIRIGDRAKVGMGAVVIKDVAAGDTVVGVPAKSVN